MNTARAVLKEDYRRAIEDANMRVRFLIADITSTLDQVPNSAMPDIETYLRDALRSAREALAAKVSETAQAKTGRGPL